MQKVSFSHSWVGAPGGRQERTKEAFSIMLGMYCLGRGPQDTWIQLPALL